MCLYYGIPHQQQGPFSMPGTTGCHVNVAGYSSSSCIFCCFNEWGKFCQAHTTSRRYCTCVLSIWVWRTRWTQGPINCAIASEGAAFLVRLEQNPVRQSTGLRGRATWESGHGVPDCLCQLIQFIVDSRVILTWWFVEQSGWSWLKTSWSGKHGRGNTLESSCVCFGRGIYMRLPVFLRGSTQASQLAGLGNLNPGCVRDGGESHPITWVSCMALACSVTTVHLMSSARWCQETVLKNQSEIIWKNDSYIVSHPTPVPKSHVCQEALNCDYACSAICFFC